MKHNTIKAKITMIVKNARLYNARRKPSGFVHCSNSIVNRGFLPKILAPSSKNLEITFSLFLKTTLEFKHFFYIEFIPNTNSTIESNKICKFHFFSSSMKLLLAQFLGYLCWINFSLS